MFILDIHINEVTRISEIRDLLPVALTYYVGRMSIVESTSHFFNY
jgi:hypothetical protein